MTEYSKPVPPQGQPLVHGLAIWFCLIWTVWFASTETLAQTSAPPISPQRRAALVIGNANYRSLEKLENAAHDGHDMCEALTKLGFEVTCYQDLETRNDFRDAARAFVGSLAPKTSAVFYYAGHGVQVNGENFFLPTGIAPRGTADIEDEGFALSYLMRLLEEARSSPNILILDSCRDNPFGAGRKPFDLPKGLARIEPPLGSVLFYATAANRAALDGKGRNGLFTKHLLANIATPGITLDEFLRVVSGGVENEAKEVYGFQQVPFRSSLFSGEFCFAGCTAPQLDQKLAQISKRAEEAAQRVRALEEENQRLQALSLERTKAVARLESRIAELSKDASEASGNREESAAQLLQLTEALEKARTKLREEQLTEQENRDRNAELVRLRNRLTDLQAQAEQIEEYKKEIKALKDENRRNTELLEKRTRSTDRPPVPLRRPGPVVPNF